MELSLCPHFSPSKRPPYSCSYVRPRSFLANACEAQEPPRQGEDLKKERKVKASVQLSRWARARRARSSRLVTVKEEAETLKESPFAHPKAEDDDGDEEEERGTFNAVKESVIYMVSDGTGWTAEESVHAALGQFEYCLVDRHCPVNTHLFSEVNDIERLLEIIRNAGEERAMLLYTLADPSMAEAAKKACEFMGVPHLDILGPITEAISAHIGVSPSGLPRGAPGRKNKLSKLYFERIEAVEFTIKQDDGALPRNLHKADIVLVGVSRTSKTPLSTYMAQKGYKVANVPLVLGIDPPKDLFEIDQSKIYALTINPNYLQSIRLARYRNLGVAPSSSYSEMDHIKKELEYSSKLFLQNPRWPVIEVTGKAIEETAAAILRIYHDRENKYDLPRISRRY